jgi:hypothetical protein
MSETQVKTEESVQTAEQDKNAIIDGTIEKISNNQFKVYMYCPPMNIPSGGVSVLFRYAKTLKDAGYNVSVIYEPREDAKASYQASASQKKRILIYEPFEPTWLGKDSEGIELLCLGEGEIKFTNGKTQKCSTLVMNPEDFMIIPEGFPNIMERTAQIPCKRIVMAQSWFYVLNGIGVGQKWQHFGIRDVISVSNGITEYLNAVMPGLSIKQFSQSIDRDVFKATDLTNKNPVISFMAGRSQDAAIKTYNVIKTFYAFYPQFRWIRVDELKSLSKQEYADRLGSSMIALYTDEIAGFGTMPLEAMACGTHVVGWTPLGGKEYMTNTNGFWATNGDVFQLAELLGHAVEKCLSGKLDAQEVFNEYEKTLSRYTPENEKESILNIHKQYKDERIEELKQLKR